jgi:hypothetical protein
MIEKLVKHIFNRIKSPIDFEGLKIIKQFDHTQNKIIFFVTNPKNLSHSREAVLSFIEDDIIRGFTVFTDNVLSHREFLQKFVETHFDNIETENKKIAIYINEQDYEKYSKIAHFVTKIEARKLNVMIDATIMLKRIYAESEGIVCECYLYCSEIFVDRKPINTPEAIKLINSNDFLDYFEDMKYQILDNLIDEIWTNKLLIDIDFMFCVPNFIFKYNGRII